MLGLYVHIPFCAAICNYCNFNRGLFDQALKISVLLRRADPGHRCRDVRVLVHRLCKRSCLELPAG